MAQRTGEELETAVVEAYNNGEGGVRLARRLGVGTSTVYHILRRHGVTRRERSARPRRFSEADEKRIAKRYADEGSSAKVAQEFGCSQVLVRTISRRYGVEVHPRGGRVRQWSASERKKIAQSYLGGESQAAVADRHGISQMTVSRILRTEGIESSHRGERHGNWKGGRSRMGDYTAVLVRPDDPYASMRTALGYVLEHRFVMAQELGRPLAKHETVHHINGDKRDNRRENLQLRQGRHGRGEVLVCGDCGSFNVAYATLIED